MRIITTNLLNRFWKNGVKPVKDAVEKKLDADKIINNLLATEPGYALDARQGKILQDEINGLDNFAVCTTSGETAEKTVSCPGFSLTDRAEITVKFMARNSAYSPKLNVNGTGAKTMVYRGKLIPIGYLVMSGIYTFRYDRQQAYYELVGDAIGDTNISSIGDGTVTGAISKLNNNFSHAGSGTDGAFVNKVSFTIGDTIEQSFYPPTNGKKFILLQIKAGGEYLPSSNIQSTYWNESGIVTIVKKFADAYQNLELLVYYLLI